MVSENEKTKPYVDQYETSAESFEDAIKDELSEANIKRSLDYIRESNELRKNDQNVTDLKPLKVNFDLMAISSVSNLLWTYEHTMIKTHMEPIDSIWDGENLAYAPDVDPFEMWYDDELIEYNKGNYNGTGHYIALTDPDFIATGFACTSDNICEQSFGRNEYLNKELNEFQALPLYDVDEFEAMYDAFIAESKSNYESARKALSSAEAELKKAKDEKAAIATSNDEVNSAKTALDKANAELKNAKKAEKDAKTALDKAKQFESDAAKVDRNDPSTYEAYKYLVRAAAKAENYKYTADTQKEIADDCKAEFTKAEQDLAEAKAAYEAAKKAKEEADERLANTPKPAAPKGIKSFKVTKKGKTFTVKWKKLSKAEMKKISGIQIRYSTDKKLKKKAKTVTVKPKASSKKIGKLKKKSTYYVRIRTYRIEENTKIYSSWSRVRKVKIK